MMNKEMKFIEVDKRKYKGNSISMNLVIVIPKCPKCKDSDNVISLVPVDTYEQHKEKVNVWFQVWFCKECNTVLECSFRGRGVTKTEMFLREL